VSRCWQNNTQKLCVQASFCVLCVAATCISWKN
jgi:hypothetical protein